MYSTIIKLLGELTNEMLMIKIEVKRKKLKLKLFHLYKLYEALIKKKIYVK